MNKIALLTAAGVLAAAGAANAQLIEARIISVDDALLEEAVFDFDIFDFVGPIFDDQLAAQNTSGSLSVDATGQTSVSVELWVQARVTGVDNQGFITFDGRLNSGGDGAFGKGQLDNYELNNLKYIVAGGQATNVDSGRTGMVNPYRATIGANNDDPGNGLQAGDDWTFLPLSLGSEGNLNPGWDFAYKFTWTSDDVSARRVTIDLSAQGGGYFGADGSQITQPPTPFQGGSFVIDIVPAPGAALLAGLGGLVAMRRRR